MCVVSMIMDHYHDKWSYPHYVPITPTIQPRITPQPIIVTPPNPPMPTAEEIEEFRRLLDRAREYDRKYNEPDCELEEKRQKLLKLAEELGIKIDFL